MKKSISPADIAVLYIGSFSGTSQHRADALKRLGYKVTQVSPYVDLPKRWAQWLYRTGGLGIDWLVARSLRKQIADRKFDLACVDSGDVIGPSAMSVIRAAAPVITNYNADNPYHEPPPERLRWTILRRAASLYDLVVAVKRDDLDGQMRRVGVRHPMLIWQCADELEHRRYEFQGDEIAEWETDVIFAGAWMPGRDAFMAKLVEAGLNIRIYGNRWDRSPNFERIKPAVQFKFLKDRDYAKAISAAKVAIVLLNDRNFDLHTTRSAEIPAIGTAMVAPRTSHHREMYVEGEEVLLFDDADECIRHCRRLVDDATFRNALAARAKQRSVENRTYNECLMHDIVERALGLREVS
jgi:spore maturation protein CgeB